VACADQNQIAAMGDFWRWPTPNPGMASPVNVVYNYPVYKSPLAAAFDGKAITIDLPSDYGAEAGFFLGTSGIAAASDEKYGLTRLEIRKPAKAYAGLGQALPHVMEMVAIHRGQNVNNWANVVIPFQVSTSGRDMDIIGAAINGEELPNRIGQTGHVLKSAVNQLILEPAFANATFSEFWGKAPVAGCASATNLDVRYFLRSQVLAIGVDTFQQLSDALEDVAEEEPVEPKVVSWLIGTCQTNVSKCELVTPKDMNAELAELQKSQGQAVSEQRAKKADLDSKLALLQANQGMPATPASIQEYNDASAAFDELHNAAMELTSVTAQVSTATQQAQQASSNTWDENKPSLVQTSLLQAVKDAGKKQEQRNDCSALGQSPVDIDSKRVIDPTTLSSALIEPLGFRYMSLSEVGDKGARFELSNRGRHLRVAVPQDSTQWPLGGIISRGILAGVSYVDIHMPGEHSVDGRVPAAELQLVHESMNGKPAMALAVPLELHDEANDWLKPVLAATSQKNASKEVMGLPMGLLHTAFLSGSTSKYFRYDGSLTKPPCLNAEWFLLEEPGHISTEQLSQLAATLGVNANADRLEQRGPAFMTSLVMKGSPHLVNQVKAASGAENLLASRFRGRRRLQV
jgi:carbonic anhydrase